jgi:4-amino-4-deoxy-L-arabinose transferase-like glycosyltransferase
VALVLLLAGTAVLYLWGLGASGWANAYYSAAAQAGSVSWKAWFFGSSDASNFITVDKTPAALWVMGLSARLFGVNSWAILVPQALEGVAAVGLLYATVRRWAGPVAGLIAGAVFALTPVAVLIFRFNNPDALLVLLLVAGAYATTRAVERGSARWLALAGACVGFGFLTKMLQAFLVLPAFALAYLVAAPGGLGQRIRHVLVAGAAMVASAGWWVAVVSLWPASSRPYIGGTQHNSVLELTLGYNGFGRLTGDETGSVGGGNGWGSTGIGRLFGSDMGGQASWLLPAALILLAGALYLTRRAPRTDRLRAALLLWGGWLLVTGATFSFMAGIIHPYYTVALAPAIGALVGIGGVALWRARSEPGTAAVLAASVAATGFWSFVLLGRASGWHPALRWVVLLGALALAGVLLLPKLTGRLALVAGVAAVALAVSGSAAFAVNTAGTTHTGAIPSAGPVSAGFGGGPGGGRGFGGGGFAGGGSGGGGFGGQGGPGGQSGSGTTGSGNTGSGNTNGGNASGPGSGQNPFGGNGSSGGRGGGMGGGMGGLLDAVTPSSAVVQALRGNSSGYRWAAAVTGSNNAAGYQLATGLPVMAIGGFNGTDGAPTLGQFQALVAAGEVHWYIAGSLMGGAQTGGSDAASQIADWVAQHYTATTVGGVTLYDLGSAQ